MYLYHGGFGGVYVYIFPMQDMLHKVNSVAFCFAIQEKPVVK